MKKIIGNTLTVLLAGILIVLGYTAVSSKITGKAPSLFGYEMLTVLSGSMEPVLKTGSVIAVKPLENTEALKVKDVITYRAVDQPDMLITHRIKRIISKNGKRVFITKGDSNNIEDTIPVPENHVLFQYKGLMIPYVGEALAFSKTKTGILFLLIIPGILIFLWQFLKIWNDDHASGKRKEQIS
ncbi:signal peptidase I [Actinomycetes bacterium NPDC127524]